MMVHSPSGLAQTVADVVPWATLLPKSDQGVFVDELTTTLMAVAGLENYAPVGQLLREWKATAEIHADSRLARRLRRSIDANGDAVSPPE